MRWLRHYMVLLDPSVLTREFAVILEASSCNAFGPEGNEMLSAKLAEWSKQLRQHPDAVEEQVGRWTSELASHQLQLGSNEYQTLRHLCAQWNTIRENMEAASALPEVLAKYRQVRDHEAPQPTSLGCCCRCSCPWRPRSGRAPWTSSCWRCSRRCCRARCSRRSARPRRPRCSSGRG